MNTQQHDRLRELYVELNQDHVANRESLMQGLQTSQSNVASREAAPHTRNFNRRWLLGSSGMAAAVLIAGVFLWRPQDALAEVQKALRSQEWIHLVVTRLDGSVCESWESTSGQMSATKWPEEIRLVDRSNSIEHVYSVSEKKLTRIELDESQHPDTIQLLIDVLLGNADRTSWSKVTQRQHRTVDENGQTWDEVTLSTVEMGVQEITWICKIDPQTHLPISYRTQVPTGRNLELGWIEGKFDYPSKGPLTIAELGVPADAELDDRIPKDSLKHIVATMKLARQKLGAYHVQLFYNDGPELSREAWKDGLKWRQDREVPEICDGRAYWSKRLGNWQLVEEFSGAPHQEFCQLNADWPYIENLTYPRLSATMEFEFKVRSEQKDGPEGCILVEKVATANANPMLMGPGVPRREQFWLDIDRDYALVKHVREVEGSEAECRARGIAKYTEYYYSDFEQSPNGVWYPTTIKSTGTLWIKQTDPLVVEPLDQHWTVMVEFAESYPDQVFNIDAAKNRSR